MTGRTMPKKLRTLRVHVLRKAKRWTPHRKREMIASVERGAATIAELITEHGITEEEFEAWRRHYSVAGLKGLGLKGLRAARGKV